MAQGSGTWGHRSQIPRSEAQVSGPIASWPTSNSHYSVDASRVQQQHQQHQHQQHHYSHYASIPPPLSASDPAPAPPGPMVSSSTSLVPVSIPVSIPGSASASIPASTIAPVSQANFAPTTSHNLSLVKTPNRTMSVDQALTEHCQIPLNDCFVAALLKDGTIAMYSGPVILGQDNINKFFNSEKFVEVIRQMGAPPGKDPSVKEESSSTNIAKLEQVENPRPSKRSRLELLRDTVDSDLDDDGPVTVATTLPRRPISIGDRNSIWLYYQQRLRSCQQNACKIIAKAWVKAIEPKKQSHHPYTGKEDRAPSWWPKPITKEDRVRHKEPDHLYKRVSAPCEKQLPAVRKSNLNISRLEEITLDALSGFFSDKENPSNVRKRPFLAELFSVAKQEERNLRGEIDDFTKVWVMTDEKAIDMCLSEDPNSAILRSNEELTASPTGPLIGSALHRSSQPNSGPNVNPATAAAPALTPSYISNLAALQQQPHHSQPQHPTHYTDATTAMATAASVPMNIPVQVPEMVSPVTPQPTNDTIRRASMYATSQAEFHHSSQHPTAMYQPPSVQATTAWHTASSGPQQTASMYPFSSNSHTTTHMQFHHHAQHGHQPQPQQPIMGSSQTVHYTNSFDPDQDASIYRSSHSAPGYEGYPTHPPTK
ncbi:hypothetical protein HOO65_040417 [Ceratocystis lukuohia]|uniref:Subtelomeric hrmA-associated cluster protein AFUB-079030/YDR124W-like helical bundle domain-containing protein n=1 Tax=Ceratocystis lukuohia TaxID=2019550 RepID=A0ABR4MIK5_9PEZI